MGAKTTSNLVSGAVSISGNPQLGHFTLFRGFLSE
jgi:hypothetical protein